MIRFPFIPALSSSQRRDWERDGYLHIRKAIGKKELDSIRRVIDWHWANPHANAYEVDVISGKHAGKSYRLQDAPTEVRQEAYKLNNLFLYEDAIRAAALSPRLKSTLKSLLSSEPVICNSLNFERGSQQDAHIDSWYMPGKTTDGMLAASIALDPVDKLNGPVFFYPGSHKIPAYRFSNGLLNAIDDEMDTCRSYLEDQIKIRNLNRVSFEGDAGDVFIWHGQLIHGGLPIADFNRTRTSLVVHYWRARDIDSRSFRRDKSGRAYLGRTLRGELQSIDG